jgi:RNA polymerase sigma-70 factor, ECF subfamily
MDEIIAIKASQTGDRSAFDYLISQYYKSIYRYAYQLTGNLQDADDISQETFLRAFEGIKNLKNNGCFKSWIFMIATNLTRCHYRNASLEKRLTETTFSKVSTKPFENEHNQPFESLSCKENQLLVQKQLLKMPEKMRMATVLVYIEEFTQKEAAKILCCSETQISRQLCNATNQLRSKFQNLI